MNYGKCKDCGISIRYKDVPLCENCRQKVINKLNACIQNGARTIKDMAVVSGLPEGLVKSLVLGGYVSVNQDSKEIKEEEKENLNKKLSMLRELKESIENSSEPPKTNNSGSGMHFIGKHR